MKTTSAVSTSTKITEVKPKISQYAWSIRCAFGECACCGEKPPFAAAATPVAMRTARTTRTRTRSFRRTCLAGFGAGKAGTFALWRAPASLRTRAFYEGDRALADRPALARAGRVRGVRRRRAPDSWRRLRARRPHLVLPAADRAGGSPRVLAVGRHVARDRRLVPQARERRPRLRT